MNSYTLNRIKSGRLINERLLRIRPIELLTLSELKVGVEYDVYSHYTESKRKYIGRFVSIEGNVTTFLFLRANSFNVTIGANHGFPTAHATGVMFIKSLSV